MADTTYDIVFIIDKSGSMDTYIDAVKNNVSNFVSYLKAENISCRLAAVEYGDWYESDVTLHDFTSDVDEFENIIASISADGAGFEYGLTAIYGNNSVQGALSLLDPDSSAKRMFIVVTDESYQENNSYSTSSLTAETVLAALNQNNVQVNVFGLMDSSGYISVYSCEDDWTPVAEGTGGKFYDITTDFSSLFRQVVDEITGKTDDGYTHRMSLAHWSYGFTPNVSTDTASFITDSSDTGDANTIALSYNLLDPALVSDTPAAVSIASVDLSSAVIGADFAADGANNALAVDNVGKASYASPNKISRSIMIDM